MGVENADHFKRPAVFRLAIERRPSVLLRGQQSGQGQQRQDHMGGGRQPFELARFHERWAARVEVVGHRDDREQQADQAHQGNRGHRPAPVLPGARGMKAANHHQSD